MNFVVARCGVSGYLVFLFLPAGGTVALEEINFYLCIAVLKYCWFNTTWVLFPSFLPVLTTLYSLRSFMKTEKSVSLKGRLSSKDTSTDNLTACY